MMAQLSKLKPKGTTDLPACITQVAAMLKQHSLVMMFSDLLPNHPTRAVERSHRGAWRGSVTAAMT